MKNVVIPTVLAATILVAVIFVYLPVEKASTVHTTITGQQVVVATKAADATIATGDDFTIDCTAAYRVTGIFFEMGPGTYGGDNFDVIVDGTQVVDNVAIGDVVAAGAGVDVLDTSDITAAAAEDVVVNIDLATDDGDEDIVEGRASIVTTGTCTFT